MISPIVNQEEISRIVGVHKTTVRNWGTLGLPYTKPKGIGAKASYHVGVTIHWKVGHDVLKARKIKTNPGNTIATGYLMEFDGRFMAQDEKLFLELMKAADIDR